MSKCEQCNKPAEYVKIQDWRIPASNWKASCREHASTALYELHSSELDDNMACHIKEKRWSTPARMRRFLEIAKELTGRDLNPERGDDD